MRVLSLDTTTRAGSMALVEDGGVVDEQTGDRARTHAERLPGELLSMLAARGWTLESIDLFAVASGPGSFTGLRIGIATMQGLAFVRRRTVVGVSALHALSVIGSAGAGEGDVVGAWIDARRGDVFSALYRVTASPPFDVDRLVEIEGPTVDAPAATLRRWHGRATGVRAVLIGDGAALLAADVAHHGAGGYQVIEQVPALAGTIGRIAAARPGVTASAAGVQPLYVRRPDAEVERERRAAAAAAADSTP